MSENQLRNLLKAAYKNSPSWVKKVDSMRIEQVVAIVANFRNNGKL